LTIRVDCYTNICQKAIVFTMAYSEYKLNSVASSMST
jgi:hypothetical protein